MRRFFARVLGFLFVVTVLYLTARAASWAIRQGETPMAVPMATQMATATIAPSATVDINPTLTAAVAAVEQAQAESFAYQQAAIDAQKTSVAYGVEAARITAQAEERLLEGRRLDATQTAHSVEVTYQVSLLTATAFVPMQTLQVGVLVDRAEQREHEQAEPTRALLLAQIEAEKKYGGARTFGVIITGAAMLAIVLLIGWAVTRPTRTVSEPHFIVPTPTFEQTAPATWTLIEPEIPCTEEQFLDFAEKVTDGERQFGVHGPLADGWPREDYVLFRAWLSQNGFTEAAARAGEVQPTARGLAFLRDVVTSGSPTPPYHFRENDGNYSVRSVQDGAYTSGGVVENGN